MWLQVFEAWLTARLLSSPTFHRGIGSLHKKVHEIRHGKDPAEMGGTNIDHPGGTDVKRFMKHFKAELKESITDLAKRK